MDSLLALLAWTVADCAYCAHHLTCACTESVGPVAGPWLSEACPQCCTLKTSPEASLLTLRLHYAGSVVWVPTDCKELDQTRFSQSKSLDSSKTSVLRWEKLQPWPLFLCHLLLYSGPWTGDEDPFAFWNQLARSFIPLFCIWGSPRDHIWLSV